ncbi:hypothetical protein KJ903_04470 [Patescibacteria group bacterium]|nr:hypothetical protein [Patescibacteria group bacterium]
MIVLFTIEELLIFHRMGQNRPKAKGGYHVPQDRYHPSVHPDLRRGRLLRRPGLCGLPPGGGQQQRG